MILLPTDPVSESIERSHLVIPTWHSSQFDSWLDAVKCNGYPIVLANGCFDLLHAGHIWLLEWAKATATKAFGINGLVVALNSDGSVRNLKGENRPVVPFDQRSYALSALKVVDCVVGFAEDQVTDICQRIKPDLLVKGDEYARSKTPVYGAEFAGRVVFAPTLPGVSTTALAAR